MSFFRNIVTPSESCFLTNGHKGWFFNKGSSATGDLNSDPGVQIEYDLLMQAWRSKLLAFRTAKFSSAALLDIPKLNGGGESLGIGACSIIFIISMIFLSGLHGLIEAIIGSGNM